VLALFVLGYERRRHAAEAEKVLWVWILTLLLVYSVPSQRSSRYLLPAMPALAVLLALHWERISRKAFALSLLATATAVAAIAFLSLRLPAARPGLAPFPFAHWLLLLGTGTFLLLAALLPGLTRAGVEAGILLAFLSWAAFLRPFEGPQGRYDAQVQQAVRGREVWAPYDFIANDERYRFLLPGASVRAYPEWEGPPAAALLARHPLVVVRSPPALPNFEILGRRLDLRGRQSASELQEILKGRLYPHLVLEEVLLEATTPVGPDPTPSPR
jgi:hypothetical protein